MTKEEYRCLFDDSDWSLETLEIANEIISRTGREYLRLDTYPNQFEIVTSEQLLDAYSSIGLPTYYPHWKLGKDFVSNQNNYQKGRMGLAYELVINSNPCISYNLEDNTLCMMMLVNAHAAQGHNSFFKNNYMFLQWTDADSIVDYMVFARDYILKCEEKYGLDEVESFLDSCHALMDYGVNKYHKPHKISLVQERERYRRLIETEEENFNVLWRTLPTTRKPDDAQDESRLEEPEENILYFIEKNAPKLPQWKREIIRIVRKVAQYFYPQHYTKVMNEGWATFCHYHIINKLYDDGYLPESFMLEFIKSHTSVVFQPDFHSPYYSGINPYALGFAMFMDIKRICQNPTDEDRHWFPNLAGKDWLEEVTFAMENFRDDSFIQQYLSPKVIRDMRLFALEDDTEIDYYVIDAIQNEHGYQRIRQTLAMQHSRAFHVPDIQVIAVNLYEDRTLSLLHSVTNGRLLHNAETKATLEHLYHLWEFPVKLIQMDATSNENIDTINYYPSL